MIYILYAVLLNLLVCTYTTAAKRKSVNLNLETVLEFDKKNLDKDVQIIDNVQSFLHKVRRVLDKSKDYRRSYNKENVNFIDFLEKVLALLVTYNDDELEELAVIIDEELRKYHYKGCKFYELVKNEKLRNYIGEALEEMRRTPARKMRKTLKSCLKKLRNREFSKKDAEFVNYVNSLYRSGARDKIHNALKRLEDFSKTGRRAHSDLVQVVRNSIRTIIFDHYSNLNANARKDFRLKLDNFVFDVSEENDKNVRAKSVVVSSDSEDDDKSETKEESKITSRKISTTNATMKLKHSTKENKHVKLASVFKDFKFIIDTTTKKSKQKGKNTVSERSSTTDDTMKFKLSPEDSEEDQDSKQASSSQDREEYVVEKTKKKAKEQKLEPSRDKTSSKIVALKYKLSSEEDRDDEKDSMSRDIEIIDDVTTTPVMQERKTTREKPTKDRLKKKRSEKGKHKKKESKNSDIETTEVTTSKHTKRKKHKSHRVKSTTKEFVPERKYSSEEVKDDKKISELNSDSDTSDNERPKKRSKNLTTEASPPLYPLRDLEEEKNRMPLRFISLYAETIRTTTEKLRPKKDKKSKKNKRSKADLHLRAHSTEEVISSEPKEKHKHGKTKHETKMVVTEDRPLGEILTEHNAMFRAESSQQISPTGSRVERGKEDHKRKHGRKSNRKHSHQKSSILRDSPHMFEMSPVSSESDAESKTHMRKLFLGNGLAIESFENNVLDGHYLNSKQNNGNTFGKRSDLRKRAKEQRELMRYRKAQFGTEDDLETTEIPVHTKQHEKEDKSAFRAQDMKTETTAANIKTTASSSVSQDIVGKTHNLEKQLKKVISKIDDNKDNTNSTITTTTINVHSTASTDKTSPFVVVNKDGIYENIETTPEIDDIPFWEGTVRTTRLPVTSDSSEQYDSDNETEAVDNFNETRLSSPIVLITNITDKTSTTNSITTKSMVKSDEQKESQENTTSELINKTMTILKDTDSSTTKDIKNVKLIRKTLEFNDDLNDQQNDTIATTVKPSKENEKVSLKVVTIKDMISTKSDGRKVNKAGTVTPLRKFKSININLNEIEIKSTTKSAITTNKEIKKDNNTTKITTKKVIDIKPTRSTMVTSTKITSTTSGNKPKLNVTLPTESKLKTDSNKTNADLIDKDKTKLNATVATIANLNNTTPSSTLIVTVGSTNVSNADNSTKVTVKGRRKQIYMIPADKESPFNQDKDSPNNINEEDWKKKRETGDLLYKWA